MRAVTVLFVLERQDVQFSPWVLSRGLRSPVLHSLLWAAALPAVRTCGGSSACSRVRGWEYAVACAVWRLAVVVARRCLLRSGDVGRDEVRGAVPGGAGVSVDA